MTLQRQPTEARCAADRLHMEPSRLLFHDARSSNCRAGAGKSQDRRGVDDWRAVESAHPVACHLRGIIEAQPISTRICGAQA